MKKRFRGYLSLAMASLLTLSMSVVALAAPSDRSIYTDQVMAAAEVFDSETLAKLRSEIADVVIKSDKQQGEFQPMGFGSYPTRKGVILVTDDKFVGLIPTGHAAIVWTSATVVESVSSGVTIGSNDWNITKGTCWGVTASNTTTTQDSSAADYCYNQMGKPYNIIFTDTSTRSKFYCSQLVWAAFLDCFGIDMNTPDFGNIIHPFELVNTSETYAIYQK